MYNTFSIPETTESFDFSSTVADVLNATFLGANDTHSNGTLPGGTVKGGMGPVMRIALKVAYMLGIIGNAAAIITLRRGERRMRNRKHLLLLTSLAANDLVALVGMMAAMFASERFPAGGAVPRWYCGARVVLRVFGVGSVCIAVTMALERYLALTRPFLYQKQVTYYMIRTTLLVSWLWAAVLTCAPMLGVGLYYDHEQQRCHRYREATHGVDYGYAVFYVMFGILLCGVLVYCNLAVIRALYAITAPRAGAGPPVVRRVSKRSCRQRKNTAHAHHNAATAEEVAFSRLMATLSVLFMFCWLPQMVTSALYLSMKERRWMMMLSNLADALMLLNYVLDPVLYVLMRQRRQASVATLCHSLADCFKRNHKTSMESTSCCPQETVVVSGDSSGGAEMRPLRPPVCTIKFDD